MGKIRIAHIINPVDSPAGTELASAQPATFESMRRAKAFSASSVEVELLAAFFSDERHLLPEGFLAAQPLARSSRDIPGTDPRRRLPFLKDILDAQYAASDAEYFVYTNADIGLQPYFYEAVKMYAEHGLDGFIINRRRIPSAYVNASQTELWSQAGGVHTGYDCFVFKREVYPKFLMGDVLLGIPHAGNDLAHNLFAFCPNFELMTDKHLTFHIGMDLYKDWGGEAETVHNRKAFLNILEQLFPHFNISNIPGSNLPFLVRHFKWLMNPTFHYPTLAVLDLKHLNQPRKPLKPKEDLNLKARYLEWLVKKINF